MARVTTDFGRKRLSDRYVRVAPLVLMLLFAAVVGMYGIGPSATMPQAAADPCGAGCGGGGNGGNGPDLGGGSMFQPPQVPAAPSNLGNAGSFPGMNQEGGVSIYNGAPAQAGATSGNPAASSSQAGSTTPAHGTQPPNYDGVAKSTSTKVNNIPTNPDWCLNCGAPHGGLYSPDYCWQCIGKGETPLDPISPPNI